jgi:hypothetical protein
MPNTERDVVDDLVRRLANHEARYQDVTIRLMLEVARCPTSLMSSASKSPTERSDSTRRSPRKKPRLQRSSLVYEFTDAPYMPSQRCHPSAPVPQKVPAVALRSTRHPGRSGYRFGYTAAPTSGRTNRWQTPATVTPPTAYDAADSTGVANQSWIFTGSQKRSFGEDLGGRVSRSCWRAPSATGTLGSSERTTLPKTERCPNCVSMQAPGTASMGEPVADAGLPPTSRRLGALYAPASQSVSGVSRRRHRGGNLHRAGPTGHSSRRTRVDLRCSRSGFDLRDLLLGFLSDLLRMAGRVRGPGWRDWARPCGGGRGSWRR